MIDNTALTISIVVIGKKNLNPGRSTTISPGKWNKLVLLSHGQSNPATMSAVPRIMRSRFISFYDTP
jgi:hypothetical protein